MSNKKDTCVDYCDGRKNRKSQYHIEDRTETARALLCSLTFKQEVETMLEIIANLKVSMRSDLDQQFLIESPPIVDQTYPSDATCLLMKELKTTLDASQFIKYIPDIDGCPVWYFVFLNPHPYPLKDIPDDDLIRRKIVAVDPNATGQQEVSLFDLCKEGSTGYIKYPVEANDNTITYQQALGELERLLNLTLQANNLVYHH